MKIDKAQIKDLVEKIRNSYLELVGMSAKFSSLSTAFEDRYRSTIMNNLDELSFLSEEYNHVRTIIAKEKTDEEEREAKKLEAQKNSSAVEAELNRYAQRIQGYPELRLPGNPSHSELTRLFGALSVIDQEYWGAIEKFLRERYPLRAKSPLEALTTQFIRFIGAGTNNIPPALTYYCDALDRKDLHKADDIAFAVTKDVAFLLNEVIDILDREGYAKENPAYIYILNVLTDFRLTEIKRRQP